MSIILKILAVLVGAFLIHSVLKTLKDKKMSAGQSILWFLAGFIIIILGIFPSILIWAASVFSIGWPPALLLFIIVVLLAFIDFNHSKEISVLRSQLTEMAEQVAIMKHELVEHDIMKEEVRERD